MYDLYGRIYVPKKTKYINLSLFNMITKINESKNYLLNCRCAFDGRKCNVNQKRNNNKCLCEW